MELKKFKNEDYIYGGGKYNFYLLKFPMDQ